MGLGKLNPGCSCLCSRRFCHDYEFPVFSGFEFLSATAPGYDPYAIIGLISWGGSSTGTFKIYKDTVLIETQINQSSPEVISLQSANNASLDGNYQFVLETECGSISVNCAICSEFGRAVLHPPPDGDLFGPYKMMYPGECVNLCDFIPQWKIPTSGYSQRPASRMNPYSCMDCSDMPAPNTGSLFWPN